MSDSGKVSGECRHGWFRESCNVCRFADPEAELARTKADRDALLQVCVDNDLGISETLARPLKSAAQILVLEEKLAEAKAENAKLREAKERMLKALKPFAVFADVWDKHPMVGVDRDCLYSLHNMVSLSINDCCEARAAIDAARKDCK